MSYAQGSGPPTAAKSCIGDTTDLAPQRAVSTTRCNMLYYAAVFFVIALIAALFGFGGIAAGAAGIAKILFIVFLIVAVVTFLMSLGRRV
jgi:uncharacterized membrane protein YtjA (UPF0391 family)